MARAVVCCGTPVNLEVNPYKTKDGEERESLRFTLAHSMTAVSGSVQFEVRRFDVRAQIEAAHDHGEVLEVVCIPDVVAFKNKKGEDDRFFKMIALACQPG